MNLYAYVHNDPFSYTDPQGMSSVSMMEEVESIGRPLPEPQSGCGCQSLTGKAAQAWVRSAQQNAGISSTQLLLDFFIHLSISMHNQSNSENTDESGESTPDTDEDNWEKIPGKPGAYRPVGKKEPIFEKDRAGGKSHGGSKWKKWNKKRDWEKGKKRDGTYNDKGVRLRD
ncbi:hypothetical protein LU351_20350 [Marinibactrum halimedae]|uniref:Uncharacterized protein n=2 Tax=Marinibactrum halimedae TaxID=1444977 RepID=A0AA37WM81_9GAMM|nr:hypothetical protein [Marinibactrum halimedae]GLS24621.1 hypothetical protein GCM10007877_03350 [Marinibactrum halimedae]